MVDKGIETLLQGLENIEVGYIDRLPDITLYMDQLITCVEEMQAPFIGDSEKSLSKFMVNNYVKDGFLRKPVDKKYTKDHLAQLYVLSLLKTVLPISLLGTTLQEFATDGFTAQEFREFEQKQKMQINELVGKITALVKAVEDEPAQQVMLGLQCASAANVLRLASTLLIRKKDVLDSTAESRTPQAATDSEL
jgi:hypothetical protein